MSPIPRSVLRHNREAQYAREADDFWGTGSDLLDRVTYKLNVELARAEYGSPFINLDTIRIAAVRQALVIVARAQVHVDRESGVPF